MRYHDMTPAMRADLQLRVDGYTRRAEGHLLFTGTLRRDRPPTIVTTIEGHQISLNPRRFLWLQSGRELGDSDVLRYTCGNPACVLPQHANAFSRKEAGSLNGRIKSPARRAVCVRNGLAMRKLSDEQMVEVMQWEGPYKEALSRFGISESTYFRIRSGKAIATNPMAAMMSTLRRAA